MNKFGFETLSGRQIDYQSNSRDVAEHVIKNEPTFLLCIECGCCSATCTSGEHTFFSPRELYTLIKRGENEKALKSIDKCMLCGKCILVCPRGVNTRNVLILANQALKLNEYAV